MKSTSAAESQIIRLFRNLIGELPPGTASLRIDTHPESDPNGTRLEVSPSLPAAAKMVAMVLDRGVIFLTFGRATPFEFQVEQGGPPDQSSLKEIETLCKAVMEGKLEENLWLVGSQVFKCTGKIVLPSETRTAHYRGSFHPLDKTEKEHIKYVPYRVSGRLAQSG